MLTINWLNNVNEVGTAGKDLEKYPVLSQTTVEAQMGTEGTDMELVPLTISRAISSTPPKTSPLVGELVSLMSELLAPCGVLLVTH